MMISDQPKRVVSLPTRLSRVDCVMLPAVKTPSKLSFEVGMRYITMIMIADKMTASTLNSVILRPL